MHCNDKFEWSWTCLLQAQRFGAIISFLACTVDTDIRSCRRTEQQLTALVISIRAVCLYVCMCGQVYLRRPTPISTEFGPRMLKLHIRSLPRQDFSRVHGVPSQGVESRVKFLADVNTTPSSSFELYALSSFAMLPASVFLLIETACVCLQILIAIAPNQTYTFPPPSAT